MLLVFDKVVGFTRLQAGRPALLNSVLSAFSPNAPCIKPRAALVVLWCMGNVLNGWRRKMADRSSNTPFDYVADQLFGQSYSLARSRYIKICAVAWLCFVELLLRSGFPCVRDETRVRYTDTIIIRLGHEIYLDHKWCWTSHSKRESFALLF